MSSPAIRERLEDEASHWAARLDGGGMSDADRIALAAWLDADPEHRWFFSRYRLPAAQLDEDFVTAADSTAIEQAPHGRRWGMIGAIAAAAAAIAIWIAVVNGRPRAFATQTAERNSAALSDGSQIELNAQTALVVDFARRERRVRLVRGEALFIVAKDPTRPFLVETPAGLVRATGTKFNVRAARDAHVEVTVLEGNVRVRGTNAADETALAPGRQATLTDNVSVRDLPEGEEQNAIAWRQGQVVFNDTALAEALERFSAYHAQSMVAAPGAAEQRLGGRYALDDLRGFLDSIQRVLGVRVVWEPNGLIRVVER